MLDLLFSVLSTVPLCITARHPGILHFTLFRKIHFSFEKRLFSSAELQRASACLNLNQLLLWCLPLHLLLPGTWSNQFLGLLGICDVNWVVCFSFSTIDSGFSFLGSTVLFTTCPSAFQLLTFLLLSPLLPSFWVYTLKQTKIFVVI